MFYNYYTGMCCVISVKVYLNVITVQMKKRTTTMKNQTKVKTKRKNQKRQRHVFIENDYLL